MTIRSDGCSRDGVRLHLVENWRSEKTTFLNLTGRGQQGPSSRIIPMKAYDEMIVKCNQTWNACQEWVITTVNTNKTLNLKLYFPACLSEVLSASRLGQICDLWCVFIVFHQGMIPESKQSSNHIYRMYIVGDDMKRWVNMCVGVEMVITLGHETLGRLFKEPL